MRQVNYISTKDVLRAYSRTITASNFVASLQTLSKFTDVKIVLILNAWILTFVLKMLSRKVEYLRYAEVKGKNSRTIWPDMTAFSKSVLMHADRLLSLSYYYSFNLFVCGVSELERELLLLVYIMIKFLFISSALSRIGENEPSSSIKRPLACSKLC